MVGNSVLWLKRKTYKKTHWRFVYLSLAVASDRIRVVTGTVAEAIRIPVIGNKRRSYEINHVAQPGKPWHNSQSR